MAGLDRAIRHFPILIAIFVLPWLLGTVAFIVLEVIAQDQLRLGQTPLWIRNPVWSPFAAMAYLALLRWILCKRQPTPLLSLDVGGQIWFATLVVVAWFLITDAIDAAPITLLTRLAASDPALLQWENFDAAFYTLRAAAWIVNAALSPWFFGLLVVLVTRGWLDFWEQWNLMRLRPAELLGVALLASAATTGAQYVLVAFQGWLGFTAYAIMPVSMIPWRANVHWAFLSQLADFPYVFLGFAIQGCILAEAYRRLLSDEDRSTTDAAR